MRDHYASNRESTHSTAGRGLNQPPVPMSVSAPAHLLVSDGDRRQTVATLQRHYVDGRLTEHELGERIAQALASRTAGDLRLLLADLPPLDHPPAAPAPQIHHEAEDLPEPWRSRSRNRHWEREGFRAHATSYVMVMTLLVTIWLLTTPGGYFWPMWPMLGWGIGLASHAAGYKSRCAWPHRSSL